mgnify:CR=1 FL=1
MHAIKTSPQPAAVIKIPMAFVLALGLGMSVQAFGQSTSNSEAEKTARIEVEWIEPKKFTDLRDRNFNSKKFREHAFKHFEEHLAELANDLPEGQRLQMKVTDVDLAGRVEPGNFSGLVATHENIRIMRNVDIPRIKFEYVLLDASGAVIQSDEVKLKDMNYLNGIRSFRSDAPFFHEKRMLTRWFEKNLSAA